MNAAKNRLSIFVIHPSQFLTDHAAHGDGLIAHRFISELAERGHRLHVCVEDMSLMHPLPDNVTLYPFTDAGVHTRPVAVPRLRYALHVRRVMHQLGRTERIDLAHQFNPVKRGLSLACLGSRVPVVLGPFVPRWSPGALAGCVHSTPGILDMLKQRIGKSFVLAQQTAAAALLVSTDAAREALSMPAAFPNRIIELPFGIDTDSFSPQAASSATPTILFLANLEPWKGIFTLLDAFDQVAAAVPKCRLEIAGDGTAAAAVRDRISRLADPARVTLLGRIERGNVAAVMQRATVYCLPSLGEPFGMSALEAMSCGKPVVVANAGGLRHLIRRGGGRHFSAGNAGELAAALIEILTDADGQREMGIYNRTQAVSIYSWPRVIDKLESIYRRVTGR